MDKTIYFKQPTTFLGRNGEFTAIGVYFYESIISDNVRILPLTSKNKTGRCIINVPKAELQEFINVLQKFVKNSNSKAGKVAYIKKVIREWGETTACELSLDCSPCLHSIGNGRQNVSQLIEHFNANGVTAITYNDEIQIGEEEIEYEYLSDDILDEIVTIMENYDADMLKTEKRCQS